MSMISYKYSLKSDYIIHITCNELLLEKMLLEIVVQRMSILLKDRMEEMNKF